MYIIPFWILKLHDYITTLEPPQPKSHQDDKYAMWIFYLLMDIKNGQWFNILRLAYTCSL